MQRFHTSFEQFTGCRIRRLTLFVLALAASLTFLSLSASKAEATCGDYLAHGMHGQHLAGSDQALMPDQGMPSKPGTSCPCRGPACERAPANTPLPVPVVSLEQQDQCLWIAMLHIPSLSQTSLLARFSEPLVLPMIAFRLDRPPKA